MAAMSRVLASHQPWRIRTASTDRAFTSPWSLSRRERASASSSMADRWERGSSVAASMPSGARSYQTAAASRMRSRA